MLPIARALVAQGHAVLFATGPDFQESVRAADVSPVVAGPSGQDAFEAADREPTFAQLSPSQRGGATFSHIIAPAKLPQLERILAEWRPDLVIYECTDMAAQIAATAAGVPRVLQGWGVVPRVGATYPSPVQASELWESRGLEARDTSIFGSLYLHPMPHSLEPGAQVPVGRLQAMRLELLDSANSKLPAWADTLSHSGRPVVYVSLGTHSYFAQPELFRAILDGLARIDLEIVATVGWHNDPHDIGTYPDRVHLERWLPLGPLLPHCSLVVCHSGSGTLLASLSAGLPLVLLPRGADQFLNAQAGEQAGVAQVISPDALTPETVRAAVEIILSNKSYRHAATRVREEIDAMPTPSSVIRVLQDVVTGHPNTPGTTAVPIVTGQ
jgi:UDP:flavonoid glycosyltransferase YjiC (YdhE family)